MLKYQHIANEIEKYIEVHELQQGYKLPSLETFMNQYQVSKSTITKSLDLLEKKGSYFRLEAVGSLFEDISEKDTLVFFQTKDLKRTLKIFKLLQRS